jgi:hypothetical protein
VTIKINAILAGASELSRAIKLADPATRAKVVATIRQHTENVGSAAKASAPVRTGELASTIRTEYSTDGMTGYVKAGLGKLPRHGSAARTTRQRHRSKQIGRGAYAPVVNYGWRSHHIAANPFLTRPYQADEPQVVADLNADLDGVVSDIGKAAP